MGYYHRAGVSGYLHGGCQRHRRPCFVDDEALTTTTCRQRGAKQERAAKTNKTENAGRNGAGRWLDPGSEKKSEAMAVRWLAKTTLQLGALFGLCHLFHVYNRQKQNKVLKFFPYPMNITTVQFAVGTVVAFIMWVTGILQRPKVSPAQLAAILPMAMVHTMVNLFTNMNLGIGKVAVSFTHLHQQGSSAPPMEPSYHLLFLRKLEPYYYLLLPSVIFLGQLLAAWFVVSLSPTTVALQSSNVPSKKLMVKTKEPLDSINLLSIITVMSFALLAPITFLTEGVKLAPRALQSAGLNLEQMHSTSLFDALCFHAYQQGLYMILARVSQHTIKRPIITTN